MHARLTQNGVVPVQEVAQFPQCAAVSMLVRQPAAGFEQAAKPLLQLGLHVPPLQVAPEAFAVWHFVPQAPQFVGSVAVGVSQPLLLLPSQLAWFARQTGLQLAPEQLLLEVWLSAQAKPQPPQLALLERSSVSQPLLLLPSQLLKKLCVQTGLQLPPEQVFVALVCWHTVPQPPQLLLSLANTTSQPLLLLPSQFPSAPASQAGLQAANVHVLAPCGAWQARPHVPQLLLFERKSTSQPSFGTVLQSAKFALQALSWHALVTHFPVAFAN
jgi:hypothetical protein